MAKYLLRASYNSEGASGLLKEGGTSRKTGLEKTVSNLGAKLECLYFTFGDEDAVAIIDAPDNATAAALSLAISSSGKLGCKTTVLLTPEDLDQASSKKVEYRAPGA